MKKIILLGVFLCLSTMNAQVDLDFNTDELPETWTTQGAFEIETADIYPRCQQSALVASIFTPETDHWITTDDIAYNGENIEIHMTFGLKDLYHALGVNTSFHIPYMAIQYAEPNTGTWITHEEISLDTITDTTICIEYSTIIDAADLAGLANVQYRFLYSAPTQNGAIFLLYWSIDSLSIEEVSSTPCETPAPTGDAVQILPEGSTIADIDVVGTNINWYLDAALTQSLNTTTEVEDMTTYYATQTIDNCESDEALAVLIEVEPLSVNGFDITSVKTYPNPVKDSLTITAEHELTEIQLFNLLGQMVISQKANGNAVSVDMSSLTAGTYILKIKALNSEKTLKIVKQ